MNPRGPSQRPGKLERRVLQALADAGGTSDTGALFPVVVSTPAEILRVLNRCLERGFVTREDHPERFTYQKPRYQYALTPAGYARLTGQPQVAPGIPSVTVQVTLTLSGPTAAQVEACLTPHLHAAEFTVTPGAAPGAQGDLARLLAALHDLQSIKESSA
ncbi:MarR family winged helix-turn-helix transcriptional regulator [Deinococcus soli (ex Cha et al. 2016)]|uniref:MarR family winged helix-turn-helix transcriptional regulator n=1 Tax=Deinococcus soli (ex Cha et al. 2016) TaxID=1309411 RepID=UPI00166B2BC4|nr:MarR family winged helix-turn-helix transcriptional regulator [Deinococcus soli (ex Cha et al. 2016)]GGB79576.1 hypothetical protein GCM10008019_39780 [Deinococcus soli (ex Cha et al. 2016)]